MIDREAAIAHLHGLIETAENMIADNMEVITRLINQNESLELTLKAYRRTLKRLETEQDNGK